MIARPRGAYIEQLLDTALVSNETVESLPNLYQYDWEVNTFGTSYLQPKNTANGLVIGRDLHSSLSTDFNGASAWFNGDIVSNDQGINYFLNIGYGASFLGLGGTFVGAHARGTAASPTQTQAGDYLAVYTATAYDGAHWTTSGATHILPGLYLNAANTPTSSVLEVDLWLGSLLGKMISFESDTQAIKFNEAQLDSDITFYNDTGTTATMDGANGGLVVNSLNTAAAISANSTGGTGTGLVVKSATNSYTFEYQKSDGTNLLRGVWDTGNFHHYLGGSLYYNIGANNFVIDGNGNSNIGLILTGGAELKLDASIDGTVPNIRYGGGSYATSGTQLTTTNVYWNSVWGWNGSNGYSETSLTKLDHVMLSHTDGDSKLRWLNNSVAPVLEMYMADKQLGFADGTASLPSVTNIGDLNTGLYFPAADQVGISTGGVAQAILDGGGASGSVLELAPTDRTVTAFQKMVLVDNTFTVDYASGAFPVGFDYGSTIIFNQNGYGFGSGFLFWYHPTVQNSSGSTRTIGPTGGFVSQPIIQANGGTFSPSYVAGFISNATINRINSGTITVTSNVGVWVQGATLGAGSTLTNDIGVYYNQVGTNSGTWTNSAGIVVDAMTLGTNKTAILLGTATIPSGSWGIYQASTTDNYFAGDIQLADGSAASPSLTFAGDTDNGLHYVGTNQWSLDAGGLSRVQISSTATTVNPAKNSSGDFISHGDTVDNIIFVDASADALGFFNASPIARPTTAIAASTFAANTSGIANDTATFDGYTIGQVVKALRNIGILT